MARPGGGARGRWAGGGLMAAPKVVYIVTEGEYSSYGIYGVFSTQEKADQYIASCMSGAAVEIWELDEKAGFVLRTVYHFLVPEGRTWETREAADPKRRVPEIEQVDAGGGRFHGVSFVSAAHAQKIAVEARQAWLRGRG